MTINKKSTLISVVVIVFSFFVFAPSALAVVGSGTFTSVITNTGVAIWDTMTWNDNYGTVTVRVRSCDDASCDGETAIGSCTPISNSGDGIAANGCVENGDDYIQYQLGFSEDYSTSVDDELMTVDSVVINYDQYTSGTSALVGSKYSASAGNAMAEIQWTEDATLPTGTEVGLYLRTASTEGGLTGAFTIIATSTPSTDWGTITGCSKASGVVTCDETAIPSAMKTGADDDFYQYMVLLVSNGDTTPSVSQVMVTYVVNAPPELQNVTATQQADGTVFISYEVRDIDTDDVEAATPYLITPSFEYSTNGGLNWTSIVKSENFSANATSSKTVATSWGNTYNATWNAKNVLNGSHIDNAFQIKVIAYDGEPVNHTASTTTASITLDVKDPVLGSTPVLVKATTSPASLILDVTDNSSLDMKIGLASDLAGSSYTSFSAQPTFALVDDPDTVYVQFEDAFENSTTIQNATTPGTPSNMMVQDTSNSDTSEWRLFLAWGVSGLSPENFNSYKIYRSTDGGSTYSLLTTITDKTINYYTNTGLTEGSTYYYKVYTLDTLGNASYFSSAIQSIANASQDAGEGGGGTPESPPTISSVLSSGATTQSVTITWSTTDKLSNSTVGYCLSPCSNYVTEQGVSSYVNSHSVTLTGLTPNTTYAYKVISTDVYSNTASSTGYSFTTNDGPQISGVSVIDVADSSAKITWNTSTNASGYVVYGTSTPPSGGEGGWATLNTSRTVSLVGLESGTKYYFYVKSQDSESNWAYDYNDVGGERLYHNFTTSSDSSAPTISSVGESSIADTSAVINWNTNEAATSQVRYGLLPGDYSWYSDLSSDLDIGHSVTLSGLDNATLYYYVAASLDANGNGATSTEDSFQTLEEQIPISEQTQVTIVSGGGGGGFSGVSQYDHDLIKNELEEKNKELEKTNSELTEANKEIADLKNEVLGIEEGEDINPKDLVKLVVDKFVFLAESFAEDTSLELNEEDIAPAIDSLRQLAEVVPPPIIRGSPTIEVGPTDTSIGWNTNKDTNSVIAYSSDEEYDLESDEPYVSETGVYDKYTTNHKLTLTNLVPSTKYNFQIKARAELGDWTKTRNYTFTTLSQLPEISNAKLSKIDDFSASLSWLTNILSDSVVKYAPVIGGKVIEEESVTSGKPEYVKQHSVDLRNLEPAKTYSINILSTDAFGNTASRRMPNFSTVKDENSPEITQVRTELTLFPGNLNKIQAIIFWKTDEPSTSQVYFEEGIRSLEGEQLARSTPLNPEFTTNHTMVITNWQPNKLYRFKVSSKDSAGNEGFSKDFTVLTPREKATVIDLIIDNFSGTFGWTERLGF